MAVYVRGKWLCGYCGKEYTDQTKADLCRDQHELIYVPFTKDDLNRLQHFLYSKDEAILSKSLIDTLQRYIGGNS